MPLVLKHRAPVLKVPAPVARPGPTLKTVPPRFCASQIEPGGFRVPSIAPSASLSDLLSLIAPVVPGEEWGIFELLPFRSPRLTHKWVGNSWKKL